jgi:4-hydroxy-tetrahydrodipicolinate reductase
MADIRPIRVVQYGLGATGKNIARLVARTPGYLLVGGIDSDPEMSGQDLGSVLELERNTGITVTTNAQQVLDETNPDVVVIATASTLNDTYPQIAACLRARVNVVSTCEELVYPYIRHPELSNQLHDLARRGGISVVGVGVNPGFIQDLLPLVLTGPCMSVQRITAMRAFDTTLRRATLHQRIGAGLSPDNFQQRYSVEEGRVPHMGLRESVHLIADRIGWALDHVDEKVDPIIASDWVSDERVTVAPGQVQGVTQSATGYIDGRDVISLTWQVAVAAPETYDAINIEGVPPIHLKIDGGLHGGDAAPALVLHALAPTVNTTPGLHTVADLAPLHYRVPSHSA